MRDLQKNGITFLKTGSIGQLVLAKRGDDLSIDWGYFYMAGKDEESITMSVGDPVILRSEFIEDGALKNTIDNSLPDNTYLKMTALSVVNDLGKVGNKTMSGYVMIGYDDIYSIQYFEENLLAN